ncbi:hypothetical protein KHA80_11315 [Anaerobacillus sp. HL2]|nr:hypothetical protein KHA80_11315 [Anaerobacillus sp. HL2]
MKNKIVLLKRDHIWRKSKIKAMAAGAKGVIIYNNTWRIYGKFRTTSKYTCCLHF